MKIGLLLLLGTTAWTVAAYEATGPPLDDTAYNGGTPQSAVPAQEACELTVALNCRSANGTPCDQLGTRSTSCIEAIFWDVEITNVGTTSVMRVNQFDLALNGGARTLMLVMSLPINPIPSGVTTGMSPREEINLCETGSYSASLVAAADVGGATCSGTASFSFSITIRAPVSGPPPAPLILPVVTTMPVPVPAPRTVPVPVPAPRTVPVPVPAPRAMSVPVPAPRTVPVPVPAPRTVPVPVPAPRTYPVPTPPVPVPTSPVQPPGNCQVICAPGFVCSSAGTSCLRIDGPVPVPVAVAPVQLPVTQPVPVPVQPVPVVVPPPPVPTPVTAPQAGPPPSSSSSVDCTVTATIECRLADNSQCNRLVPRTTNCQETLFYTIGITNNGDVPLTPTVANLFADGQSISFLGSLPSPLQVGQSATGSASTVINVCGVSAVQFSANLEVRATPPNGVVCRPSQPPPQPAPQPVSPPVPVMAPAPLPTFTMVDCTVFPHIQCVLLDGRSCSEVVSRTTNCGETFRYVLSIQNTGSAELEVTVANIVNDGTSTSFLQSLGPNPIPIGEIATAAQDVTVDVCGSFQFSAMVDVSVAPSDDSNVCSSVIPQPTTINIGGPAPQPVPAPSVMMPVQSPTTTTTLVDCIILSTLESCTLADNSPCSSLQLQQGQCDVELFFNVRLENAGSIELTLTEGNLISGGQMIDFVPNVTSNPLSVGQVSTVSVPITANACQGDISASIDVTAIPPPGNICR